MRIAVNTRLLLPNKLEGIGRFTHEVLSRMVKAHPEHEFIFLFDRKFDEKYIYADNVKPVVIHPQARHPFLYYIWFEFSVKRTLSKYKADLYLSPDGYLSLRSKCKQIAVFHDLNFEHFPRDLPFLERKYYRTFFPKYAKKANRIITVSNFSKEDIQKQYGIEASKIDVAYNGINEALHPIDEEEKGRVKIKYTDGQEYFIFIGSLHPRKNLVRLFKAFDLFKEKNQSKVKLVVVGDKFWWNSNIENTYQSMKYKEDVVFTGHLQTHEMNQILGASLALVYISYFEGFGIPLIEAMKCKIPVITSNVTSMPEIADDAAILINPFDIDEIASALDKISNDGNIRKSLINRGLKRVLDFDWNQTSIQVYNSITKVLDI